jgi:hypothetical protein
VNKPVVGGNSRGERSRRSLVGYALALLPLLGITFLFLFQRPRDDSTPPQASINPAEKSRSGTSEPSRVPRPALVSASSNAPVGIGTAVIMSNRDQANQLINQLFSIDLSAGKISQEQAAFIKDSLQQLSALGVSSVFAIRDFLERDLDLPFSRLPGGEKLQFSSLRAALFDVLKDIGGPEAIDATLQILGKTADPREVALLSRNVEQLAPGQYRSEVLQAARESIDFARSGALPDGEDVAPLFQVLSTYGNASVVPDLETAMPNWNYYGALTLASIQDGAGIPALVKQLDDPGAVATRQNEVALQVLTQVSWENPVARDALISRAQSEQIPNTAWAAVADTLAGLQFEFGKPLSDGTSLQPKVNLPQYQVGNGEQILFSTPTTPSFLEEQIGDRLRVVEQLLASTKNPVAIDALQKARETLNTKALAAASASRD